MKTIKLPIHDIVILVHPTVGQGSISSNLAKDCDADEDADLLAAINAVESLILAHACAGIDVSSEAYVAGIETAVESIFNIYG